MAKKKPHVLTFNPGMAMPPAGAATITGSQTPAPTGTTKMPADIEGSMPSNRMFPRLRTMATGLTPNPGERVERREYPGPGRFVGNIADRKTPHGILRIRTVNEDPAKGA